MVQLWQLVLDIASLGWHCQVMSKQPNSAEAKAVPGLREQPMKGLGQFEDDVRVIRSALTAAGVYEEHRDVLHRMSAFVLAIENQDASPVTASAEARQYLGERIAACERHGAIAIDFRLEHMKALALLLPGPPAGEEPADADDQRGLLPILNRIVEFPEEWYSDEVQAIHEGLNDAFNLGVRSVPSQARLPAGDDFARLELARSQLQHLYNVGCCVRFPSGEVATLHPDYIHLTAEAMGWLPAPLRVDSEVK